MTDYPKYKVAAVQAAPVYHKIDDTRAVFIIVGNTHKN